jgi:hypothetical protein
MMALKFKEFLLTEILDKPFDYELSPADQPGDWLGHFKDDSDAMVLVNFEYWGGPELYIIDFKRNGKFELTHDSPKDRNQGVRIMTTVIAIIKDFIKRIQNADKRPAKFIAYSIKKTETSRGSLYNRLMKRMASAAGYVEVHDVSKIDHPVLPNWWKNKLKLGDEHNLVLLAQKAYAPS